MLVLETCERMQQCSSEWELGGKSIALVPTMGALHAGHVSLIERAKALADHVIVSIFVNPAQFGPNEDWARYPRQLEEDKALLLKHGVDVVYIPDVSTIYPDGFTSKIQVTELTEHLCGANRPGHFDGVATVVYLLLQHCMPHMAIFGEKDWQQLTVIRRMVEDFLVPVEIIDAPTLREEGGLALSSRNTYLSESERSIAFALNRVLKQTIEMILTGAEINKAMAFARESLREAGFSKIDYVSLNDENTLEPLNVYKPGSRLFAAAYLGDTRLIDNMPVKGED